MPSRAPFEIRDRAWAVDFVSCTVLAVLTVGPYVLGGGVDTSSVLALGLVLPLLVRRTAPGLALGAMFLAAIGTVVAGIEPMLGLVAIPFLIYTLARSGGVALGRLALAAGLLGSVIGPASWSLSGGLERGSAVLFLAGCAACAGIVGAAYLMGRRRREGLENARARAQSDEERDRLRRAEQEQRDRMAAAAERNRIARELHDIIAHSLSVIVVQAEGGKALAAKRPEKGPEVLGTIADTSREALEEMRRMVGLLRSGVGEAEQAAYVPTPGLDDLPDLVRKTSATAELATFGAQPRISPALALTAYRIVQESLTNVLKHAGPAAQAWVKVGYTADLIEIEVSDNGRGFAAGTGSNDNDGMGHGLQGMHERVALHHGRLSAQPRPGGGFVVRAWLPVRREPAGQAVR